MDLDRLISKEYKESETAKSIALAESQSINGESYTIENLKSWRKAGIEKPSYVYPLDWHHCESGIKPKDKTLCRLKSAGMDIEEISKFTGYSVGILNNIFCSKLAREECDNGLDSLWGKRIKQALDDVIPMAIQTAFQIMMDPKSKPSVRADVAFKLMERTMGKPVQQIEMKDNLLRSVFEKLDAQSGRVIEMFKEEIKVIEDAEVVEKAPETAPVDPIDAWAEENI